MSNITTNPAINYTNNTTKKLAPYDIVSALTVFNMSGASGHVSHRIIHAKCQLQLPTRFVLFEVIRLQELQMLYVFEAFNRFAVYSMDRWTI